MRKDREYEKHEESDHQHLLALKIIDHKATEWAKQHGSDRVAAQHQPNHVFRGMEMFAQIKGQQRREQIEGEEKREIGNHHLAVIPIPKFLCVSSHPHQNLKAKKISIPTL